MYPYFRYNCVFDFVHTIDIGISVLVSGISVLTGQRTIFIQRLLYTFHQYQGNAHCYKTISFHWSTPCPILTNRNTNRSTSSSSSRRTNTIATYLSRILKVIAGNETKVAFAVTKKVLELLDLERDTQLYNSNDEELKKSL